MSATTPQVRDVASAAVKHRVVIGDSLDVLRQLPDESVNLIITSPPYADQRKSTYGGVPVSEYVEWFKPFAAEMLRVLADDGSFILNIKERVVNGERSTYVYELVIALRQMGWLWTEEYIWHKTTTAPGKWPNRFRDLWEHCYHFTKNKKFTMNQEAVMVPVGDWSKSRLSNLSDKDRERQSSGVGSGFGKRVDNWVGRDMVYPGNVLHGSSETRNTGHSAAFPLWLPRWFIELFSNPGDLVLDPFLGSGTTLIAANAVGRRGFGVELLEEHEPIISKRLTDASVGFDIVRL